MDQQALLSDLVREEYGAPGVGLHAIPLYLSAERAIERTQLADGQMAGARRHRGRGRGAGAGGV